MINIDFSKLGSMVNQYRLTPEKEAWEKSKQLFFDITEGWESEDDIDYSIPISKMVEMIENTADFINEKEVYSETLEEVSKKIEASKPVRLRPRLL